MGLCANGCCKQIDSVQQEIDTGLQQAELGVDGIPDSETVDNPRVPVASRASRNSTPSQGPGEFTIVLDKTGGDRLGIDVDHENGHTLLIECINSGLVQQWNTENPKAAVQERDHIVQVN